MSKTPNRLGKGLSALIGPRTALRPEPVTPPPPADVPPAAPKAPTDGLRRLPIDRITANPRQPRTEFDDETLKELAASIRTSGVLQPLLVRPSGDGFELIAGERRLRASKLAGLREVPAIVREMTDAESLEVALVENLQREDLGPLERAAAYQEYIDEFRSSAEQLSARLGESRVNIVNYLRLLRLPEEIQAMIRRNELGMGEARCLVSVADPQRQLALARLAVRRNLSVRQVEALVKQADQPIDEKVEVEKPGDRHLAEVASNLSRALGLPVKLKSGKAKNSGTIVIRYSNLDEFDRIAERIVGKRVVE
ncbi:MAG: ParB/RepB/Spo0J family partition protein [Phycisphaerales bacterium]|nr:ParB/RepB/Spo0J family partition protein [Phycisphaerales bacterium]